MVAVVGVVVVVVVATATATATATANDTATDTDTATATATATARSCCHSVPAGEGFGTYWRIAGKPASLVHDLAHRRLSLFFRDTSGVWSWY